MHTTGQRGSREVVVQCRGGGSNPYAVEPIDLEAGPPKPDLPGTVVLRRTRDELFDAIAADVFVQARACVQAFGDFHLAVSAGDGLNPLYQRLMYDPNLRSIPWKRTHLWLTCERCDPPAGTRSAFSQIEELIVDPSDIPGTQVHFIDLAQSDADIGYERDLKECLEWREKGHDRLDCVLLTLGSRGEIAGLNPGLPCTDDSGRLAVLTRDPTDQSAASVTMTQRLINASRFVGILAVGTAVRSVLARIESRTVSDAEVPVVGIDPVGGELRWYVDSRAGGG